jgi:hypothetical protein
MHTFFINDWIQLYRLRYVSNMHVFILRKTCTWSFVVFFSCIRISSLVDVGICLVLALIKHILPSTRLLIWLHERNTIKLHVQVFLRMNTCMFETCRRRYNLIKSLMKKVCIVLVIITLVYQNARFKKRKVLRTPKRMNVWEILFYVLEKTTYVQECQSSRLNWTAYRPFWKRLYVHKKIIWCMYVRSSWSCSTQEQISLLWIGILCWLNWWRKWGSADMGVQIQPNQSPRLLLARPRPAKKFTET